MNFKKYHVSRNLFDYATQAEDLLHYTGTRDYYLNSSGSEISSSGWWISDYIEINDDTVTVSNVGGNAPAICCYNSNKEFVRGTSYNTGGSQVLNAITIDTSNAKYVRFSFVRITMGSTAMLNTGSQPLPYEPYGNSWHDIPHYIHKTDTDILTTLPAVVYPNAATATVGLKGQTVQSGTPTPQNPVMPEGCGERTAQLFDKSTAVVGYGVDNNSGNLFRSATLSASDYINISGVSYIRAKYITSGVANQYGAFYDSNKTFISGYSGYSNAIAVPQNAVYTRITARTEYIDEFMLNSGSSALPYEPYWT